MITIGFINTLRSALGRDAVLRSSNRRPAVKG
jgi:hypothetical protein